jgi:hypothetical protein
MIAGRVSRRRQLTIGFGLLFTIALGAGVWLAWRAGMTLQRRSLP